MHNAATLGDRVNKKTQGATSTIGMRRRSLWRGVLPFRIYIAVIHRSVAKMPFSLRTWLRVAVYTMQNVLPATTLRNLMPDKMLRLCISDVGSNLCEECFSYLKCVSARDIFIHWLLACDVSSTNLSFIWSSIRAASTVIRNLSQSSQ